MSQDLEVVGPPPVPRGSRGTAAPDSFEISQRLVDWLDSVPNNHLIDMGYETEKFLDHHRARGTVFKDWEAGWRNWMRRAIEWAPVRSKNALSAITPQAVLTLFDE